MIDKKYRTQVHKWKGLIINGEFNTVLQIYMIKVTICQICSAGQTAIGYIEVCFLRTTLCHLQNAFEQITKAALT